MALSEVDFSYHYAQQGSQPFKDRRATMPWRSMEPVAAEKIHETWQALIEQVLPPRKRLVYVHIPFCATHCSFCGFYQNRYRAEQTTKYTDYLLREIEMESMNRLHQSAPVHAVYFGGGTPSALAADELHRVVSKLRSSLPLAPDCEITLEGRILEFDDERIDACLAAGVNRFSIGIQTFDTEIRKRLGRKSTGPQAVRFMKALARRDRAAVVCDLIFGLPHQDEKHWAQDLAIAGDLGIDGIDLYALNLLSTTPLAKVVEQQRVTLPTPAQRRDRYLQGAAFLERAGWQHISNSHWARTTRERNLYNLLIKQGADCLALGAGGGGSLNGCSYMVERRLEKYYEAIDRHQKPLMMMTRTAEANYHWRHDLQAGIETGRIPLDRITPHAAQFAPLLKQWHQSGLTLDDSTLVRLTHEGRFWASNILQSLQQLIAQANAPHPTL